MTHPIRPEESQPTTVAHLLADLREAVEPGSDEADQLTELESLDLVTALGELEDDAFAPEVLLAVDSLLEPGESVTPTSRNRMIAGAERASRWRRALAGPLPVALRAKRENASTTLDQIAELISLEPKQLADIELGKIQVQKVLAADLARWVRAVELNDEQALAALKKSLSMAAPDAVYASRDKSASALEAESNEYYDAVESALRDLSTG